MLRRRVPLLAAVLAVCLVAVFAEAGRGSGGTYTLPAGNPVTSGTTITSTWANATLADIATALSDSLSRSGLGAMTAPLQHSSGSAALPSVTFSAEPTSGLYRAGAGDIRMSVGTSAVEKWQSSGVTITGTAAVSSTVTGAAATFTATGTSDGVTGIGGPTSGWGVTGNGTAASAAGVKGNGGSAGNGVEGYAHGVAWGVVGNGDGTANGNGVQGIGYNAGTGVQGTGGATGIGVKGTGTPGGQFAAASAATGGTRTTAAALTNGDLSLDGVTVPNTTTALKNRLTPVNIVKAAGHVTYPAGTPTLSGGFNITSVASSAVWSGNQDTVTVTFAQPMVDANYQLAFSGMWAAAGAFSTGVMDATNAMLPVVGGRTANGFTVVLFKQNAATTWAGVSAGTVPNWNNATWDFIVTGAQ